MVEKGQATQTVTVIYYYKRTRRKTKTYNIECYVLQNKLTYQLYITLSGKVARFFVFKYHQEKKSDIKRVILDKALFVLKYQYKRI